MSFIRWTLPATALLLMFGCAGLPSAQHLSERRAAYERAAGAPVPSFRFVGSLYSWEPLSDDELVVYTRPTRAWLINLAGCQNLGFTSTIALTSNLDQVSVNFDKVITERAHFPCTISQIRPLDLKGMRASSQKREIRSEQRPPSA